MHFPNFQLESLALFIPHMLFALSVHEASHAYVAYLFGDDTAAMQGRATLIPTRHIDPLGLAAFFFIGLGWAKPVPVNLLRLKNPRRDNLFISLAGPTSNLLVGLALMSGILFVHYVAKAEGPEARLIVAFLMMGVFLNIGLFFFNLLPMPPLDGGHVLFGLLPERLALGLEPFRQGGIFVLVAVIALASVANVPIFQYLVAIPMRTLVEFVLGGDAFRMALAALEEVQR